jgi:hypothetical protein
VASEWQETYTRACLPPPPQKKGEGRKEKKKIIQFKVRCLMLYKGKLSAFLHRQYV